MLGIKNRTWTWSLTFNESLKFKSLGYRGIHDIESREHETKQNPSLEGVRGNLLRIPKSGGAAQSGLPNFG